MEDTKVNVASEKERKVVICAIIKDEPDLEEWLAYHFIIGFHHVYLYDNLSKMGLEERLKKFIDKGLVTVVPKWKKKDKRHHSYQVAAYNDFLTRFKKEEIEEFHGEIRVKYTMKEYPFSSSYLKADEKYHNPAEIYSRLRVYYSNKAELGMVMRRDDGSLKLD